MLTFLSSQCWHLFIVAFYLRSSRLFRWQVVFNWKQSFSYYVLRLLILFKPLVLVGFPRHLSWRRRDATHYCLEVDVQVPIQPPLTPKKGCPHSCCTGVGVQAPLMIIDTVEGKKRQAHYWPGGMKILASCLASPPTPPQWWCWGCSLQAREGGSPSAPLDLCWCGWQLSYNFFLVFGWRREVII